MRVLFLSDAPTVSGAELVLRAHLQALADRGDEAHVVLRASNQRLAADLDALGVAYTACPTFSIEDIRTTVSPRLLAHFGGAFRRTRKRLRSVITQFRPDVLHCVSYPAVLYGLVAASGSSLPVIWHEHNIKRLHWANRHIIKAVAQRCRVVVGPSNAVTTNIAAAGANPSRLRTIYNGVDLARFVPSLDRAARARAGLGLGDGVKAVGLPGQLLPYKGHGVLIEAAPALVRRFGDVRFFIVGALENPPYQAALADRLRRDGLSDRFVFTGWRQDIAEMLQAMDVIAVPTITPEPAALTLIETMALAQPVVATRTGGTPELVMDGETGLLIAPGSSAELAEAIGTLLADPARARRMGEAGRRRIEAHFTMTAHQAAILRLYDEIAGNGAS
jgi:glycosyltransferase involved in cell wall biosynthesis